MSAVTMPVDFVVVRHGESEGNLAKRHAEGGRPEVYTPEFLSRHSADFRLTQKGPAQAQKAGAWIREHCISQPRGFDRFVTSEHVRAMETATQLGLPDARWYCDFYLAERDWGDLDNVPPAVRAERYAEALRRRELQPFH